MARSKEEREQRKLLLKQKQEARRLAREKKAAAATPKQSVQETKGTKPVNQNCPLLELVPEDAMQQVFFFLDAQTLGAFTMTCTRINYMLPESRVPFLCSRLHMCRDESEACEILKKSLQGNTDRLVAREGDEFVSYARFLQEAFGYSPLGSRKKPLQSFGEGRFASASPDHSLCRVGGDNQCGAGGSGVASWGVGKRGQLGHGKREDVKEPKMLVGGIGYGIRIVQVSAGGGLVRVAHSLLLTASGRVLSFGTAQYGQLGHGYSKGKQLSDELRPRYIDTLSGLRCTCVSAGELHSAVVTSDGDVYTWGDGFCGQLGLGDKRPQLLPRQVLNDLEDECVASVSCGNRHTLCVTDDGDVLSFGLGHFGVLGREFTPFEYDADTAVVALGVEAENGLAMEAPVAAPATGEEAHAAAVPAAPEAGGGMSAETMAHLDLLANLSLDDSSDQCIPKVVDSLEGICIVGASAGHRHSMFLDDKGGLYTCGSGGSGALGHGDFVSQGYPSKVMEFVDRDMEVLNMSAGVDMSMAVTTTGDVYAWGKTDGGRIGLEVGGSSTVPIPRQVILEDENGDPVNAVDVECGYVHSLIVGLTGTVYQCGHVGTHGEEDGQVEDMTSTGHPSQLKNFNIWHRIPEPKEKAKKEKWRKYGKYELRGRSAMMSESERWNT